MPDTPLAAAETTNLLCAFVDKLMNGAKSDVLKTIIDTELSCTQFQTLTMLYCDADAQPIHWIAEQLGLSVAATGRGVDKLVRLGLVVRREDEHDRRIKRVSLSVSGRKLVADQFAAVHDRNREFVTRLPDGLRQQLSQALSQILLGGYLGPLPAGCIASTLPSKGST
ncbi:MAG TPA: MarR family winged helix-turn-helix transcriptional regulator [Pseudonocardiaceae bacterium]|nr:MarR family winged helix-turn-helix transcriptional regulator [Pseudonocardiaceae bacterium]